MGRDVPIKDVSADAKPACGYYLEACVAHTAGILYVSVYTISRSVTPVQQREGGQGLHLQLLRWEIAMQICLRDAHCGTRAPETRDR